MELNMSWKTLPNLKDWHQVSCLRSHQLLQLKYLIVDDSKVHLVSLLLPSDTPDLTNVSLVISTCLGKRIDTSDVFLSLSRTLYLLNCSLNCILPVEHIVLADGDDGHGVTRVGAVLIRSISVLIVVRGCSLTKHTLFFASILTFAFKPGILLANFKMFKY